MSIIDECPELNQYVFTTGRATPISGWSKAKAALDKKIDVGVYDRHARDDEKRAAMDRWAARLVAIVGGGEDNVVPIRRGS
jgi:hypothetical protein